MSRGSQARTMVATVGMTLIVVALGAPTALAGESQPSTHIRASNSPCVDGVDTFLPSGDTAVNVQLWRKDGTLRDSETTNLDDDRWSACLDVAPKAGQRIDVRSDPSGALLARLTIPTLSVKIDRATDVVRGSGPNGKNLRISVTHCAYLPIRQICPDVAARTVTVNGSGTYSKDLTSGVNLRALDGVEVRYADTSGDRFAIFASVPALYLNVGTKTLLALSRPGSVGKFWLSSEPGGSTLSSKTVTASDQGESEVRFSSTIKAGRQVRSDIAPDAVVNVVPVSVKLQVVGDDQVVQARCLPDRRIVIDYQAGVKVLTADHNGHASFVSPVGLDTHPQLDVYCQTSKGDVLHAGVGGTN